jgi:hypothetical protein
MIVSIPLAREAIMTKGDKRGLIYIYSILSLSFSVHLLSPAGIKVLYTVENKTNLLTKDQRGQKTDKHINTV